MKKLYRLIAFLLLTSWACLAQGSPTNILNTVIATFPGAPIGGCSPTMIATRTDTSAFYGCFGDVWTAVSSGAGTVTSVTGTTNQISVATGTTAPVISLPSAITFPGTLALALETHGAPVVSNTSGQLATSPVSIDAGVQTGADWSIKVNVAFTALGSNFGTVDARGFTGTQAMSVSVTVPPSDVLLLRCLSILRATGIQLIVSSVATVKGCGMGGASFIVAAPPSFAAIASGTSIGSAMILGNGATLSETQSGCFTTDNNICADQYSGDFSAAVNTAFRALGTTVGTVDARGFTANQTMSVSINIPKGDLLLLPCVTITRAIGAQIVRTHYSKVRGCGIGGNDGSNRKSTQVTSDNTDTSAIFTQTPTNAGVFGMDISDLDAFCQSTCIGIDDINPEQTHYLNMNIHGGSIGIHIGGLTGGCACYNDFKNVFPSGTTYGYKFDDVGSPNSNTIQGGRAGGATAVYLGVGADGNQFVGVDIEQAGTASWEIAGLNNIIHPGYSEQSAPLIFDSGASDNWVIGGQGYFITDNSGNTSNITMTSYQAPQYWNMQQGAVFGGSRLEGLTNLGGPLGNLTQLLVGPSGFLGGYISPLDLKYATGGAAMTLGAYGHSPLYVGGLNTYSGQVDTGQITISTLANPAAPTVVTTGGTGTNYTYYVVCHDWAGGVTLPSSGTTVSGGATLSGTVFNTITPPQQDGCRGWDILKTNTSTLMILQTTCGTGAPCKDTGQSTSAYSAPVRNSTGDESIAGNLTVTGHNTLEGIASTGATGTGKIVFDTSPTLTKPALGAATATSLLATGVVDGTVPAAPTTQTACRLGTASSGCLGSFNTGYSFNEYATAGIGVTYTLPTAAAGKQYCVANAYNGSAANTGALTLQTSASGQYIIFTDGTLTTNGGYVVSGGAAADSACVVGVDSTHWFLYVRSGTWAKH